ncbi:FepA family TonB-dependent siderophore receptor [Pasteurellaceae bacterium LIM206]|nr:FepA family TonB-dependent siderophore receptor [Pasteurellaceae bacterium LIM206]
MTYVKTKVSIAILIALGCSSALAEEQADQLGEIKVTSAEDQVKQSLGASVITAKDIEERPVVNDISEILRTMPGVNLTGNSASGARGNKRQIDIRGMGPENTLIMIDGKPVTSRQSERYSWTGERNTRGDSNWVPAEAIESIEVLRGPAAARYGSGAMGGVVNIITKPTANEYHGSLSYYINQPESSKEGNTNRVGFSLSGPIVNDVLSFRLYGSWNKTKPDAQDINKSVTGTDYVAGREGVRNKDIAGRLDWKINENHKLSLDASYSRQGNIYNGDTQYSNGGRNTTLTDSLVGSETARLYRQSYALTHTGKYSWGDSVSYIQYDQTVNSRLPEGLTGGIEGAYSDTGFTDSKLKNTRFNTEFHIPFTWGVEQMLTIGAEAAHSSLSDDSSMRQGYITGSRGSSGKPDSISFIASSRSGHTSQSEYAVFIEDNIAVTGRTFLTPAIRYNYNTRSGSNLSGGLNFDHSLTNNLKLKGGIARAYKAPNLYQSNSNYLLASTGNGCAIGTNTSCYLQGNDNLKPETSWNKEIGLEYAENDFLASIAYFHNDYRNKIYAGETAVGYSVNNYPIYQWTNIKRAIVEGLEGNLTIPLIRDRLKWTNNVTYMIHSENKETGNPLSVIPKFTVNSTLNLQVTEAWDWALTYTQYGKQRPRTVPEKRSDLNRAGGSGLNTTSLGSYAVWGINTGYKWNNGFSARIGISNLFDKKVLRANAGASTYNEPGRAYYATVKYTF